MSFPTTDDHPSTPKKNEKKEPIISTININDQVNFDAPFEEANDEDVPEIMVRKEEKQ